MTIAICIIIKSTNKQNNKRCIQFIKIHIINTNKVRDIILIMAVNCTDVKFNLIRRITNKKKISLCLSRWRKQRKTTCMSVAHQSPSPPTMNPCASSRTTTCTHAAVRISAANAWPRRLTQLGSRSNCLSLLASFPQVFSKGEGKGKKKKKQASTWAREELPFLASIKRGCNWQRGLLVLCGQTGKCQTNV